MNKENIKNIYFNNFKIKALYSGENLIFKIDLIEKNIYEYSLIPSEENFSLDLIPDILYNNLEVPIVLKISAINKPDILLEGKKSSFSINIFEGYKIEDIRKIEIKYDKADFISNTSKLKYNLEYVYNIDISLSKNIDSLFSNCVNLKKIPSIDISEVDSLNNLFYNCNIMQGYADPDKYWNLRKDLDDSKHEYCFYNCKMLSNYEEIPMSWNGFDYENEYKDCLVCYTFDSSKESNYSFGDITHLPNFDFVTNNTKYSVEDEDLGNNLIRRKIKTEYPCERVSFNGNKSVVSVEYLNTDNMDSLYYAFAQCPLLEKVDLSLSNTTKLKDMSYCFSNSDNIKEINLGNINVENVKRMDYMFNGCIMLSKLNIDNWKTSSLVNTMYMFANCKSLKEIDISHFDTKNINNAIYMFSGCTNANIINIKNFRTDSLKIEGVSLMFTGVPSNCLVYVDSNFLYTEYNCSFQGKFIRNDIKDIAIVDGDFPKYIDEWSKKGVYFYKDEENLIHIKSKEALEDYRCDPAYQGKNLSLFYSRTVFYYDLSNIKNLDHLFYNSKLTEKDIIIDLNNNIIDKNIEGAFEGIEYYNKNSSSTIINSVKLLNINFGILNNGDRIRAGFMFINSNVENIDLSEIILGENTKFELWNSFNDCINLKRLDLSNICYIDVDSMSFSNLPSLEYLNLSNTNKLDAYTSSFLEINRNCEILLNKNLKITESSVAFRGLFKRIGSEEICNFKKYVDKSILDREDFHLSDCFTGFFNGYNYFYEPLQLTFNRTGQTRIRPGWGYEEELVELKVSGYAKDSIPVGVEAEYLDKFYISNRNNKGSLNSKVIDDVYCITDKIDNKEFYLASYLEKRTEDSISYYYGVINNVHIKDKLDITSASDRIKIAGITSYFDFNNKLILPNTIKKLYLVEINCESYNLSNIEFLTEIYIDNSPSLKSIDFSNSILPPLLFIDNNENLKNINLNSVKINSKNDYLKLYFRNNKSLLELDLSFINIYQTNLKIYLEGTNKDCIIKIPKSINITEEECKWKGTFTRV